MLSESERHPIQNRTVERGSPVLPAGKLAKQQAKLLKGPDSSDKSGAVGTLSKEFPGSWILF